MAPHAEKSVCPGTSLSNDLFVENEIQIGQLGEDRQGIFVSFSALSFECCVCIL